MDKAVIEHSPRLVSRPQGHLAFEWGHEYLSRDLAIVPIPHGSKNPGIPKWQDLRLRTGDIERYFGGRPMNLGVMVGQQSGWLVDIDLDSSEAIKLANFFLPESSAIFGRSSKRSSHRLYRCTDAEYKKFNNPLCIGAPKSERTNACIVEIRAGKGKQTVFPPSTHESGERITWVRYGEPPEISRDALEFAVSKLAAASLLLTQWRRGIRHDLTLALAGTLLRNGFSVIDAKHLIEAICTAANDEELQNRLKAVEDTSVALVEKRHVFGTPKLVELTEQRIVDSITAWLHIRKGSGVSEPPMSIDDRITVVCMRDVEAKEVTWLWNPFIPMGEFTILEGIEGIGKSWIGFALACAVASGAKLPFHEGGALEPGNVLLLSAEDSLAHTLRPRLDAMGAALERIFAIDEVFSLNDTIDLICFEAQIAKYRPKLVFIDPMFSYTAGKDLNAESSSRPIAQKLIALAQKYNCAIVGVRHVGKSKGQGDPRNAGLGSISWRASARSVLLVGQDTDTGERAICQTKANLAAQSMLSVGFSITDGQFTFSARPSSLTKERMLAHAKDPEAQAEQSEAVDFLRETLRTGERASKEVEREAKELGITNYALRKAKPALGIESFKKGGNFGGDQKWYLRLSSPAEVVDIRRFQHLQENPSVRVSRGGSLHEGVELEDSQRDQECASTSSNGPEYSERRNAICECGETGYVGYSCRNCGVTVQG